MEIPDRTIVGIVLLSIENSSNIFSLIRKNAKNDRKVKQNYLSVLFILETNELNRKRMKVNFLFKISRMGKLLYTL